MRCLRTFFIQIIDVISRASVSSANSSTGTVSTNLRPLITPLRSSQNPNNRGCLLALNEAWNELESMLARVGEERYPEARELYDLLSDDYIRVTQLLTHTLNYI